MKDSNRKMMWAVAIMGSGMTIRTLDDAREAIRRGKPRGFLRYYYDFWHDFLNIMAGKT